MWEERGANARPMQAKWSSGVAGVFWVYYNKMFSKIHVDITTTTATTTTTAEVAVKDGVYHTPRAVFQARLLGNQEGVNTERYVFGKLAKSWLIPDPTICSATAPFQL